MVMPLANTAKMPKTMLIVSPFGADCVEKDVESKPWSAERGTDGDMVAIWIG